MPRPRCTDARPAAGEPDLARCAGPPVRPWCGPGTRDGQPRGRRGGCGRIRPMSHSKTNPGNFFEDFTLGQVIEHATPRTITEGDRALYGAIYPTRFALPSSAEFAASVGLSPHPVEELIGFHVAFGKTVPDVSLNAVANLGYAECRFHLPVVPGRHAPDPLGGDRPEAELQRPDRRGLRPLDRHQPARRDRAGLGALGDGAQARRRGAGARDGRARARRRGRARHAGGARRPGLHRSTTSPRRASRTASATTRWARRSTTSTGSP